MTTAAAAEALAEMFARKYAEAVANGATDDQALNACRALWLEGIGAK